MSYENGAILETKNLYKKYPTAKGYLEVINNINLEVKRGEFLSVVGESGVGKSTLMHILGLLDRPTAGEVVIDNFNCFELSDDKLADYRNKIIGFVFQLHHLLPEFTALENVILPQLIGGKSASKAKEKGMELLTAVGIANRASHYPNQLSGGEKQRVAFCRALANEPNIVIADEPTGDLDEKNSQNFVDIISNIQEDFNVTFILATHNLNLAANTDRVLKLHDGKSQEITREVKKNYG